MCSGRGSVDRGYSDVWSIHLMRSGSGYCESSVIRFAEHRPLVFGRDLDAGSMDQHRSGCEEY